MDGDGVRLAFKKKSLRERLFLLMMRPELSEKFILSINKVGRRRTFGWRSSQVQRAKLMPSSKSCSMSLFDTPKPISLGQRILSLATSPTEPDIVLDFFAGSGTTGHAVIAQNAADAGSRRFVLVQLPEPLDTESLGERNAAELCDA